MSSQKIPIILNLIAAVAGAFGQYLYKKGGVKAAVTGVGFNAWTVSGILMFCVVMGLFVFAYKLGGRISVVYPFYATTFIWGTLIGILVEKEPWHPMYSLGLALVLSGTAVIAWASGSTT